MSDEDFIPVTVEQNVENLAAEVQALNLQQQDLITTGDVVQSRYEVIRKLGSGWYSRVWLCKDQQNDRSIALKVLKDESDTSSCEEVEILKHVRDTDPDNGIIVILLDDFDIMGVNNEPHVCMVFEAFGCSIDVVLARNHYRPIPMANVKSIVKQSLEGLDFLHTKCQVVHGDFKLKNILLENDEQDIIDEGCDFKIKIADLGYSYSIAEDSEFTLPISYGVEVLLFDHRYGPAHDIWNIALNTFELATGDSLFEPHSGDDHSTDEDHLAQIFQLLGEIPLSMATTGDTSPYFFNEKGELYYKGNYKPFTLVEVLTMSYKWEEAAAKAFADFLLPMMDYDITKRPTAAELLQHPWLLNP